MKKVQEKVKEFTQRAGLTNSPTVAALDLLAELGEVAKEMLKSSRYGKGKFEKTEDLESELGDVLYSLITLANAYNVDLEKSLDKVIEKYEKRLQKGDSPGSENE